MVLAWKGKAQTINKKQGLKRSIFETNWLKFHQEVVFLCSAFVCGVDFSRTVRARVMEKNVQRNALLIVCSPQRGRRSTTGRASSGHPNVAGQNSEQ